jgi:hypothetical protein
VLVGKRREEKKREFCSEKNNNNNNGVLISRISRMSQCALQSVEDFIYGLHIKTPLAATQLTIMRN